MADPLWTSDAIARATGGTAGGGFAATGVSIDTRSIEPGDLFVALAGVRGLFCHPLTSYSLPQAVRTALLVAEPVRS
mgnify:CR=1 FL=1